MNLLRASHVTAVVDDHLVLNDVSLSLRAGELVALIGPNGAGKTSLLRVLAQALPVTQGSLQWRDQPLSALAPQHRAAQLAYLAQGAPVHWPLTVDKLVALGRLPHLQWWQKGGAEDREAIDRALRAADVESLRDRVVSTLSGGERMRVLLARVFATEPMMILADEPVAALDPYHQLHIMELLQQHCRDGKAILVVLHDLNLAARYCDRLLLMHEGRLVADGEPAAVLTPERLASVYGIEALVEQRGARLSVLPGERLR